MSVTAKVLALIALYLCGFITGASLAFRVDERLSIVERKKGQTNE